MNMKLLSRYTALSFAITWISLLGFGSFELNRKVVLISLERPRVIEVNPELCRVLNVTSRRPGRSDPVHYIHLWLDFLKPLGNTSEITITIFEFLSNEYRPSFVYFKMTLCDFFTKFLSLTEVYYTTNTSTPLTRVNVTHACSIMKGIYYFANLSFPIANLPVNFPFEKGRVFTNHTYKGKLVLSGSIDLELHTLPARKYKSRP